MFRNMGIPGLTSYIAQRSENFSKEIKLHNTKLVIDGFCLACRLYHSSDCSCCFGGDYGKYAHYVSEFFDELQKCKITPLIVFDGGIKDKKRNTILDRYKERILRVSYCTPTNEQQLMPLLAINVFRYVVEQKNIKLVQSTFEADEQIASIARILKCPVLSNDSDFFIFDVMYIPISSLKTGIFNDGDGFFKHCRVYTNDNFITNFSGMDKKNLPLAAALLGNDYIDDTFLKNFLSFIGISNDNRDLHYKIETILRWLQNYSMDQAITIILDKLYSRERKLALEMIEMVINGYLETSLEMFEPLGYTSEEIEKFAEAVEYEHYKFNQTETLKLSEKKNLNNLKEASKDCQVYSSIPSWFLKEFNAANFPGSFISMLLQQGIIASEQMEDHRHPSCIFISLEIIKVIFKLLSKGTSNSKILRYMARGKGITLREYRLDCNDDISKDQELPTLEKLPQLPQLERKQILNSVLEVSDQFIMEFPPTWRLYVAVIKYWSNKAEKIFVTKLHLYSLILLIIYHVMRRIVQFGSYFEKSVTSVDDENHNHSIAKGQFMRNMSVEDAIKNVKPSDCTNAVTFFKSSLSKDEENFDREIVHAFSLLQNVMNYSISLNALLGYPYPKLDVAEFFSGTVAYNFYRDLKKHSQLNKRITVIFENSPSLLQLFISISTKLL